MFNRNDEFPDHNTHHLLYDTPLMGPYPDDCEKAVFGMGCFWGAEKLFWDLDGIYTTAVGYMGGHTEDPTYKQVCRANTGHAEVVLVVYDPTRVEYEDLVKKFWENHDPTTKDRQGNDRGPQYRSCIFTYTDLQNQIARRSLEIYNPLFQETLRRDITTHINPAEHFYFAETYHQQYLIRHPHGYCNHGPNGVSCPLSVLKS